MRANGRLLVLATALLAAACAPRPEPEAPPPRVDPAPRPAPTPPPTAPARDWADRPLTAGDWAYDSDASGAHAIFGNGQFVLRCDRAGRRILLVRQGGQGAGTMTVRTSYGARSLAAAAQAGVGLAAALPASDPLLDQIAFSRGRFSIEVPGSPQLMLPAWPETARVIEDCRL